MKSYSESTVSPEPSWICHALAHVPHGWISIFDRNLRYRLSNGKGLIQAGLKPENLVGKSLSELYPPEIAQYIEPYYQQALNGHTVAFDLLLNKQWFTVDASPIFNGEGEVEGLIAVAHNSDKRKGAEAALEKTNRELVNIWERMTDGFFAVDTQWRFTYINALGERILQRKREDLLGKNLWHEFPDAVDTIFDQQYHKALTEQVPVNFETFYPQLGIWTEVRAYPSPTGLSVYFHDINERKQAAMTQTYFAAIVQSTNDAIIGTTLHGVITSWNNGATKMFGYTADEAIGRPFEILVPPASQEEYRRLRGEHLKSGQNIVLEKCALRKDGTEVEISMQATLVRNEAGEIYGISLIARDVTAQKQAARQQAQLHRAIKHQHRRLDEMLANVPGTVWENTIDVQTGQQHVNYVSKYVETMLGYTQQEWLDAPDLWLKVLHPDDRERILAQNAALLQSGGSGVLRYRFIARDGHAIWTETHCAVVRDEPGNIIGLRGVTMDITERMQAQEEQSRLAALLESTSDLVGWADTEGNIQYVNPAGRAILGLTMQESIEGCAIPDFSPAWATEIILHTGIPYAAQHGSWSGETAFLSRDGREIPMSQVITVHKDAEGNPLYYSTVARDISEIKKMQLSLERANEELEERVAERTAALEQAVREAQAARLEAESANRAKSEFLSRMSHELRTPMNAILGFGQILEMRKLSGKESESVQQILKAGRHLLQLINEILEISRIEAGRLALSIEPIGVLPMLREVQDLVQPLATARNITMLDESGNSADAETPSIPDRYIMADRHRLQQVMLNLLSNAIKYNREDGRVVVSVRDVIETDTDYSEIAEPALRIEVRDTGYGIAEEDRQKIFLPFERLNAETTGIEGTGIGLTLTRRLVELMGGRIGVESDPGHGSTFWVQLPVAENPIIPLQRFRPETAETTPSLLTLDRPITILYIEDNVSNLAVMQNLLKETPQVRLLTAIQGSLGLDLARQHRPDLILLDLHLPHMSGEEVLRQLMADSRTNRIPVVVVSADATPHQIDKLLAAGASDYITKPIDFRHFVQVLEILLKVG